MTVEAGSATVGDLQLAFEALGDPAAEPLLLIPSHEGQLVWWPLGLCQWLVAAGFRVIRYDTRDAGLSTRLPGAAVPDLDAVAAGDCTTVPYCVDDLADDAAGLLAALGVDRAHVAGHATGAMVAQCLAIRHPRRVRSLTLVTGMTVLPVAPRPSAEMLHAMVAPLPEDRAEHVEVRLTRNKMAASTGWPFDDAAERELLEAVYDRGYRADTHTAEETRKVAAILCNPDHAADLAGLSVPTVVAHGDADPLLPLHVGEATAAAIPDAELMVIAGLGHDLPRGAWPQISAAITHAAGLDS